jgi:hypothetical protein
MRVKRRKRRAVADAWIAGADTLAQLCHGSGAAPPLPRQGADAARRRQNSKAKFGTRDGPQEQNI